MLCEAKTIESEDAAFAAQHLRIRVIEKLKDCRIAITGGTGFLGSWIVETLRALNSQKNANIDILIISRSKSATLQKYPEWASDANLSILEHDLLAPIPLTEQRVNYIIHGATDVEKSIDSQLEQAKSIILGTYHVLDFTKHAKPTALMYMSSGAAAGRFTDRLMTEESINSLPGKLDETGYAHAKKFSEFLVTIAAQEIGFTPVITRGFSFVGPRMPINKFAIGNFLLNAARGEAPNLNSMGLAQRSFMYASDAAVWYLTMMVEGMGTYNVGSDQPQSLLAHAIKIAHLAKVPPPVVHPSRSSENAFDYAPQITRATSELGLEIFTKLDDAIFRTLQWIRVANVVRPPITASNQNTWHQLSTQQKDCHVTSAN